MSETKIKRFAYLVMMFLFAGFAVTTSRDPALQYFCVGFVVISAVCCWFQVGWFAFGAMVGIVFWIVLPSHLQISSLVPASPRSIDYIGFHYYRLGYDAAFWALLGLVVDFISRRFS